MHEGQGVTNFIISVSKGSNNIHNELSIRVVTHTLLQLSKGNSVHEEFCAGFSGPV